MYNFKNKYIMTKDTFFIEKLDMGYIVTHEDNKREAVKDLDELTIKLTEILKNTLLKISKSTHSMISIKHETNISQVLNS